MNAARELSEDEKIYRAWECGNLFWLLHPDQLRVYNAYRRWELRDPAREQGQYTRVFMLDIGKRWGKTTLRFTTRMEDCLRYPGRTYRYVSAFQKTIEEIVDDVSHYVLETCPRELRPQYKGRSKGRPAGFYCKNGSLLALAGLDKDPDALRGKASDGDDISEAAFVDKLLYSVKNVLYHQYQGRPWARMCLESSAPLDIYCDYEKHFVPDCKARGAHVEATIDDNPRLSHEEREEFIRAAGGRDDPDCQREYFNKRVRLDNVYLIPEFTRKLHVRHVERPSHAHAYVGMDPGMSDKCALIWAYWDFERAQLVIERGWAKDNAGTSEVAEVMRTAERELWGTEHRDPLATERQPLQRLHREQRTNGGRLWELPPANDQGSVLAYWDADERQFKPNPFQRWSDDDAGSQRLASDLHIEHGLSVSFTAKDDAEAQLNSLRTAFRRGQIVVLPEAENVVQCIEAARWRFDARGKRVEWDRSPQFGHFDLVAALMYLWRNVSKTRNPFPPRIEELDPRMQDFAHAPWRQAPANTNVRGMREAMLGNTRPWR